MPKTEHMVLCLSDLQPGMRTPTFDVGIFRARWELLVDTVIRLREIHASDREVPMLHIVSLGDLVEGEPYTRRINIAEVDVDDGEIMDILAQKQLCQECITGGLIRLRAYFDQIRLVSVPGNHGAGRGKDASKRSNDDTEVCLNVRDRLKGLEGVSFDIETNSFYRVFEVLGTRFMAVHGHQVRMWSRVPQYGIINKVVLWHRTIPEPFDAVLMGHFHNLNLIDAYGTPVYMNGCFGGGSDYELERGLAPSLAQWVLGVHPDKGIVWERRIRLGGV